MAKQPTLAEDNADTAAAKKTRGFSFDETKPIPPKNAAPHGADDDDDLDDTAEHEDRLTRDQESRYAAEASDEDDYDDDWEEQELLDAPDPRPGFVQHWVRTLRTDNGQPDAQNLAKRLNQGWRPRSADTLPRGSFAPTIQHGDFAGVIGIEGMILMERPQKRQLAHRRRVREETIRQMHGVESDMHRAHDPKSGLGQPIFERNKSNVTRGRPVEVADDD